MNDPTPGPWSVHTTGDDDCGFPGLTVQSEFGLVVRLEESDQENRANARLIACAPYLLTLCGSALRALHEDDFPHLRAELRALIARAEGRS